MTGRGKPGVEYRYYKESEYDKVTKEQKVKLYDWKKRNETNTGKHKQEYNQSVRDQKISTLESKVNKLIEQNQKLSQEL